MGIGNLKGHRIRATAIAFILQFGWMILFGLSVSGQETADFPSFIKGGGNSAPANLPIQGAPSLTRNMALEVSTPALLFPAVSLLFLAYTNRFLHLAALIRTLHKDWLGKRDDTLRAQIENLRKRLGLIRWMQLLGAISLIFCVCSMVSVLFELVFCGVLTFLVALFLMGASLVILTIEIWCSGGALKVMLDRVEEG